MTLRIEPIACLADNYAYLVVSPGRVAVVDPGEAGPIEAALSRSGLGLHEIWCTHHHLDHVAGVPELLANRPGLVVRGSDHDGRHRRIDGQSTLHGDDDHFDFDGHDVHVLSIPGHTLGAIAFVVDGALFSGDTLFLGGCGRVFEGTMPMMAASMDRLRSLDPSIRVFCGHEYTLSNLRFARSIEPGNEAITEAIAEAERALGDGRPTVPGTLARELETNPFLRFDRPEIAGSLSRDDSFARLRIAKNEFRG